MTELVHDWTNERTNGSRRGPLQDGDKYKQIRFGLINISFCDEREQQRLQSKQPGRKGDCCRPE
eukprot:12403543-Alexandrium_andersonii.AAC.1